MRIEKFYIMKHILLLFATFLFSITTIEAQPNANYYKPAEGKTSAELKTALYNIIKGHTTVSYTPGVWNAFETTDRLPNGKMWDIYSTCNWTYKTSQCGSYTTICDCYNREHSVPKSWFNVSTESTSRPPSVDIHHLYPTDGRVNGERGNFPYGEVGTPDNSIVNSNESALGKRGSARSGLGYSGTVFEPVDDYKGDLARTYFYMVTRYQDEVASWNGADASKMLAGNAYPAFNNWAINMLLRWSKEDPVSEKETNRNNAVEKIQKNRNPFIDHPNLAEYIWGENIGQSWYINNSSGVEESLVAFNIRFVSSQNVIYVESEESNLQYTLYNINGQMQLDGFLNYDYTISTDNLQNGVYILMLQSNNKRGVQKLIINK